MEKIRALFILKRREDYSTDMVNFTDFTVSTGMFNSAKFVSDMLVDSGFESTVVVVTDNNDIDREVTNYQPTHVFIEGFWVIPEKFDVLKPLHPTVKWIVRCHSEISFLAQEGIAMGWVFGYLNRGITVAGNSPRINRELRVIARSSGLTKAQVNELIPLLPNYYKTSRSTLVSVPMDSEEINIGCFGAIRPMKNHLGQAIAAIEYADVHHKKLNFHINVGRTEMNGSTALKNLRELFANLPHALVEHYWMAHPDFLAVIDEMDLCMQVSFTETFNIVTADAVSQGIPVVVSSEMPWVHGPYAEPTSTISMVDTIKTVLSNRWYLVEKNREGLQSYSSRSKVRWGNYLTGAKSSNGDELSLEQF